MLVVDSYYNTVTLYDSNGTLVATNTQFQGPINAVLAPDGTLCVQLIVSDPAF